MRVWLLLVRVAGIVALVVAPVVFLSLTRGPQGAAAYGPAWSPEAAPSANVCNDSYRRWFLREAHGAPLVIAARLGSEPDVARLLADGADPNASDDGGWTALHVAALTGQPDICELLIAAGADVAATTGTGATALHIAARLPPGPADAAQRRVVRVVAAAGLDVNTADFEGQTPLDVATKAGKLGVAAILTELGASRGACPAEPGPEAAVALTRSP